MKIEDQYFEVKCDIKPKKEGLLSGFTISLKDCICLEGVESKSSSKILSGYKPPFSATVVEKILSNGGRIIGKSKQDEFGFGSFGLNHQNPPFNPLNKDKVTGGSSSGAGGLAKTINNHISIAESTGGSIANPAAFCEVIGLTPSYGRVSRFGLIDYATSLDKIGVMAKDVMSCAKALEVISGFDEKDSTSSKKETPKFSKIKPKKEFIIGVPKEYLNVDLEVKKEFDLFLEKIKSLGLKIKFISLEKNAKYSVPTYYLIATSEASTNLAKLSGLRYGVKENPSGLHFNDYFKKIRSQNFSLEAKRRILLGTFARMEGNKDDFYDKALMLRKVLFEEYKKTFEEVDLIIHPTMPCFAPNISDAKKLSPSTIYNMDLLTVGVNLAGLPHISIPFKSQSSKTQSIGALITTKPFFEEDLLSFSLFLEEALK
ncbi:MAG: amidase family protein [Candidatus Woesearchaeota archaeon]